MLNLCKMYVLFVVFFFLRVAKFNQCKQHSWCKVYSCLNTTVLLYNYTVLKLYSPSIQRVQAESSNRKERLSKRSLKN